MSETNQAFKDWWKREGSEAFLDNCKAWGFNPTPDETNAAKYTAWDAWLASRIAEREDKS